MDLTGLFRKKKNNQDITWCRNCMKTISVRPNPGCVGWGGICPFCHFYNWFMDTIEVLLDSNNTEVVIKTEASQGSNYSNYLKSIINQNKQLMERVNKQSLPERITPLKAYIKANKLLVSQPLRPPRITPFNPVIELDKEAERLRQQQVEMQMAANQQSAINKLSIFQQQESNKTTELQNSAGVISVPDYVNYGVEEMRPIFMDGHQIGYGKHKRL